MGAVAVLSAIALGMSVLIISVPVGFFSFIVYVNSVPPESFVETEIVIEEDGYQNTRFTLRPAKSEEADIIYQNMVEVYRLLENKDLYVCDDLEWVKEHMENQGFGVVAYDFIVGSIHWLGSNFPSRAGAAALYQDAAAGM